MLLERPDVLAEVTAQFDAYERALVADDAEAVVGFFAPGAVRFGIADQQVGLAEQLRWRRAQAPLPPGRRLHDTRIVAYGTDVAVVTTLFGYPGGTVSGRQSQTWVRLPEGWRIVSAHVSEPARDPVRGQALSANASSMPSVNTS
jgi:hypothetical protein